MLRATLQVKRGGSGGCLYRISVKGGGGGAHPLHLPPESSLAVTVSLYANYTAE